MEPQTTMTPRDIVRSAIRFRSPARLPFTGSMSETDFSGDTVALFPDLGNRWWLGGGGRDEWGCEWEVSPGGKDMGQVRNRVLASLQDFEHIVLPDATRPERYAGWESVLRRAEAEEKYVVLCNGPFLFERAHFLHGFIETLMAAVDEPAMLQRFLRHLARYHFDTLRHVKTHFAGRIHGYRGTDDWGTQHAPLVSPAVFSEVFQPVYADLFGAIHEAGMDTWMHSCGHNLDLLPALIDAGLDVVNLLQPSIFPVPRLQAFRGRICFEMAGDLQRTLPTGDREAIAREIDDLLAACCTDTGGLIVLTLDQAFFDAYRIPPDLGRFCVDQYRLKDPWRNRVRTGKVSP